MVQHESGFRIISSKELLDEQILLENGRFRLRYLSRSETNRVLERALSRMKAGGWSLTALQAKFWSLWGDSFIFEPGPGSSQAGVHDHPHEKA